MPIVKAVAYQQAIQFDGTNAAEIIAACVGPYEGTPQGITATETSGVIHVVPNEYLCVPFDLAESDWLLIDLGNGPAGKWSDADFRARYVVQAEA